MKPSLIIVALALGCASSQTNRDPTASEPATQETKLDPSAPDHGMMGMCPMAVEGTTVRSEELDGSVALVFTTTGDVADLRRRVAHMAEMHGRHHQEGRGHGMHMHGRHHQEEHRHGRHMHGSEHGDTMMMPPSAVRSEEVDGGARLVFTPRDPADLASMREHVHQHAERMAGGQCPMMPAVGRRPESSARVR